MLYAQRGNKIIRIAEAQIPQYKNDGFDILDDGKIVEYGRGKTISPDQYLRVVRENEALKIEIETLKAKKPGKKAKKGE